jgi:hypothetical protein
MFRGMLRGAARMRNHKAAANGAASNNNGNCTLLLFRIGNLWFAAHVFWCQPIRGSMKFCPVELEKDYHTYKKRISDKRVSGGKW